MKKFLLVLFALISFNCFAQLQVKEGSFKYIPGGVIEDREKYKDYNEEPMALIKISTENINEQERLRLVFNGNRETMILKEPKTGQMWVYLTAGAATFLNIKHPDYGTYKYNLPEKLCGYCVYEMVLQYVIQSGPNNYLIIKTDMADSEIYIDDEHVGKQFFHGQFAVGSTHSWRIEYELHRTESGNITITSEENLIDIKMVPEYGFLNITTTPEIGAKVYINDKVVGATPYKSDKMSIGNYNIKVVKDQYRTVEQIFVVKDKETTNANINMQSALLNVTVSTDSNSKIYVDNVYKAQGQWTGKIIEGTHTIEARKGNHRTVQKIVELVAESNQTIILDSPKAINGSLEISCNPSGAEVYIDGKHYGQTPCYINEIIIGEHGLKLTKQGCASMTKTITIKEGETLTVNEKLQTGKEITIKTDKSGDKVYIDGQYIGVSPITSSLSFDSHEIKAERDGKVVSKNITVSQYESDNVVNLYFSKNVTIDTDLENDVIYVDDKRIGTSPLTINLTYGTHKVKVVRNSQSYTEETIVVDENGSDKFIIKLGQMVKITSTKSGDKIFVDDNKMGVTPTLLNLSLGKHNVLVKRGKKKDTETIYLNGGLTQEYKFYPSRSYPFWNAVGDVFGDIGYFFGDVFYGVGDFFGNVFDDGGYVTLNGGVATGYRYTVGLEIGGFIIPEFGLFAASSMCLTDSWYAIGGINIDTSISGANLEGGYYRVGAGYSFPLNKNSSTDNLRGIRYLLGMAVGESFFISFDWVTDFDDIDEFRMGIGWRW